MVECSLKPTAITHDHLVATSFFVVLFFLTLNGGILNLIIKAKANVKHHLLHKPGCATLKPVPRPLRQEGCHKCLRKAPKNKVPASNLGFISTVETQVLQKQMQIVLSNELKC